MERERDILSKVLSPFRIFPLVIAVTCVLGRPFARGDEAEIEALNARFDRLEKRINTLEAENAQLKREIATAHSSKTSQEIAALKRRMAEVESTADKPSTKAIAASKQSAANAEAIKSIELSLESDATETRDIYRGDGWPFDITKFYDLPQPFEFHGYLRSGFGMNGDGGKMEAFQAPGAGAKFRLGNEADTYGEIALTHNWLRQDDPTQDPYVRTVVRMSYSTGENFSYDSLNNQEQGNDIALREAYVEAGNVVQSMPDVRFWIGQRYYQRYDINIDDFYFLDMSGYGGGVEDAPIGNFAKLSLAWFGGSVDHYITNNGRVAKQSADLRLTDIKTPGGKLALWFDYSYTKGGDVLNVFNEDGSTLHAQSSGGWAVGLIDRTDEENLWGGYNEVSVQYGKGAAYNFATTLDQSGPDLNDASRFRATDQLTIQPWPQFAMQAIGVFEDTTFGGPNTNDQWESVGARPVYFFNDRFSIALEAGIDWARSEPLGTDGHLWKITLAPQISYGGKFFSRPVLRAFVTYSQWSNGFKGFVGGEPYRNATEGWSYGLQTEAWW